MYMSENGGTRTVEDDAFQKQKTPVREVFATPCLRNAEFDNVDGRPLRNLDEAQDERSSFKVACSVTSQPQMPNVWKALDENVDGSP